METWWNLDISRSFPRGIQIFLRVSTKLTLRKPRFPKLKLEETWWNLNISHSFPKRNKRFPQVYTKFIYRWNLGFQHGNQVETCWNLDISSYNKEIRWSFLETWLPGNHLFDKINCLFKFKTCSDHYSATPEKQTPLPVGATKMVSFQMCSVFKG